MTTFQELAEQERNSLQDRKEKVSALTEKEFKSLKMSEKLTQALCNVANVNKKTGNANQTYFLEDRNLITRNYNSEKEEKSIPYLKEKVTDLGLSVIKFYEENGYPIPKKRKKA